MTEVTLSARVPQELSQDVAWIMEEEGLEKSAAIRKLLRIGVEKYRKDRAVAEFARGDVTFSRGAAISRLSVWEFADLLRERRVPWVPEDVERDLEGP
ncbi:MAG: UPF0175 family protein [Candidatus Thermoplasmatota archaeon]|nr:UPF0175 family protein [Candidatus Thermoplasmatota archaeon]